MPATIWICLVEGPSGEQRIRAWTPDADRAEAFRKEGLEMQEFSAVAQASTEPAQIYADLRRLAIVQRHVPAYGGRTVHVGYCCKVCQGEWDRDAAEFHALTCTASPVPSADRP